MVKTTNNRLMIGDIVSRKDGNYLRSGCEGYEHAIVISTNPFCLISEESDMRWSSTIHRKDFKVIGKATPEVLARVAVRWQRDRINGEMP